MTKTLRSLSPASRRLVAYAALRIDARRASGVISEEILCNKIHEYVQSVARKTGEVEPRFSPSPPSPRGGAPLGDKNRVKHGHHAREVVHLRAQVRAFVRDAKAASGFAKRALAGEEAN